VCSADATPLAVVQETVGPDGAAVRNFKVYRRAADGRRLPPASAVATPRPRLIEALAE
jgi:hypothetical protein